MDPFGAARYRISAIDLPPEGPDHEIGSNLGAYMVTYLVEPDDAAAYTLGIHSARPGIRALTGVYATPKEWVACIISRGTPFLGDTRDPHSFVEIRQARRSVVDTRYIQDPRLLLLITDLNIVAVSAAGIAWSTGRLALDGIDVATTPRNGWLVCSPRKEPGDVLLVNLQDGRVALRV
ncbi:hypothetical protein [Actinomyces procaprae]|uniref:hypothetical protein n=1 Tax=Actinomyces procaprae TaxID=2560010 RepID=UPI0010A1F92B|nr:hypothetical protein [Actinomyces procaprae]